ncbi:MAG: aminoacyl-tRNA hydrolase [Nevskiaceae bacterium]|nr:aminoacyl-tRNA hydrolase [Nevskiaceae bacterium]
MNTAAEADDYQITFVRSAGPGGQNVNKVATAAQLRFFLDRSNRLDEAGKARLRHLAGRRLTDAGDLLIIARNHRTQEGNRREALARLETLLIAARHVPKVRKATKPTRASQQRRVSNKLRAGRMKSLRGKVRGEE